MGLTRIAKKRPTGAYNYGRWALFPWPWVGAALPLAGPLSVLAGLFWLSGRVDVQGMKARGEFRLQRLVDGAMLRQPGESGERHRTYLHRIMCLAAGRCASMTVVEV